MVLPMNAEIWSDELRLFGESRFVCQMSGSGLNWAILGREGGYSVFTWVRSKLQLHRGNHIVGTY